MSKIGVLNIKGEKIKDINLNDECWNIEPNDKVLYNAIILARASLRQGTQSTKTRAEVRGGGRKPWAQKETGRARQGSIRSPQWVGGGVVFAPKPRDYGKKMNRKERRLALRSAFTYKVKDKNILIVDSIKFKSPKTKEVFNLINSLNIKGKILFITDELDDNAILATRNIDTIRLVQPNNINVLDIVNANYLVITEDAVKKIEEVLI